MRVPAPLSHAGLSARPLPSGRWSTLSRYPTSVWAWTQIAGSVR